eukprot:CAMPEP_0170156264 /NCGR_PEP_ID=MMETSP0033_2-20121228/62727_1 /TAXON_ID=195969 /ORGANISM="Dolichomastix tenuilepis, Strain CCMP3274" /LENGTH=281 /DNA_ID=CAMNT_0010393611 /DNA_START=78 /DNA_END=919 /DNA_ORIENTATION=+
MAALVPGFELRLPGLPALSAAKSWAITAAAVVMPTVWVRDLSLLSYLSAGGVFASVAVVALVLTEGVVPGGPGFHASTELFRARGVSTAIGLFSFCYSGHAVFPSLYSSMGANKKQFDGVLVVAFSAVLAIYTTMAVGGYLMYGDETESQITLSLPTNSVCGFAALVLTVINPISKYALTMGPVAMAAEELLPPTWSPFWWSAASLGLRSALVLSTLFVGLGVPFFDLVMGFIGSFLSQTVSVILPAACALVVLRVELSGTERALNAAVVLVGVACACVGT